MTKEIVLRPGKTRMSEAELREAMKMRPALVQIDTILGNGATPDQKMELFGLFQDYMALAIRRTIGDLTGRGNPG